MSRILVITTGAKLIDEGGHIAFAKNCPLDRIIRAISKGNPFAIACEKSKQKTTVYQVVMGWTRGAAVSILNSRKGANRP
jgi:hypothetical protein